MINALLYLLVRPLVGLIAGAAAGKLFAREGDPLNRNVAVFVALLIIGLSWLHAWHVLGSVAAAHTASGR